MREGISRPALTRRKLVALAIAGAGAACGVRATPRPLLRIAIGDTAEEIESRSGLKFGSLGSSGKNAGAFLTTPLTLVYDDRRLELKLADCGASTTRSVALTMVDDRLAICTAPVLADYSTLDAATARALGLLGAIQNQGFHFPPGRYARLAYVTSHQEPGVNVPHSVANIGDVVPYLLNPRYCVSEFIVFKLVKDGLGVDCRLRNLRRTFPIGDETAIRAREDSVDDGTRRREPAWDLAISFAAESVVE